MATKVVEITPPNLDILEFKIIGSAPYVQNKFSQKAREEIEAKMESGKRGKQPKKARNFEQDYEQSKHISSDGWCGIPASAFRSAMVSACRLVGFTMTQAKLAVFIVPDGFDRDDGTPLVKITKGEPEMHKSAVRIQQTMNIACRAMWHPGWEAIVRVQYDADMFKDSDIANLMARVGMQVGVGEGRPDSKTSTGVGWGTFVLDNG